ncbi:MAG TPA: hypothetical protein PKE12_01070 [Kiritimatiellia bacterium]|nr:hypothetical protein [Kiritimatiellia bacterium]
MRPLKFLIGLFLLPAVWIVLSATARLFAGLRLEELGGRPHAVWWLAGGFLLWLFLFFTMPRPMRTYVLAHELTHAFWALLMGARVSRLRVSARGGSVNVSKSNWIITLAPYFFPFYTVLVVALVFALGFVTDLRPYEPLALALVGLTYAFHLTFTVAILLQRQPDIQEHGRLFSYTVIIILNLLGAGLGVVAAAHPTWRDYAAILRDESQSTLTVLGRVADTSGLLSAAKKLLPTL